MRWNLGDVTAADDDGSGTVAVLAIAEALAKNGVSFSLHVYPKGPHGIGLGTGRDWNPPARHPWTHECQIWLKEMGFAK